MREREREREEREEREDRLHAPSCCGDGVRVCLHFVRRNCLKYGECSKRGSSGSRGMDLATPALYDICSLPMVRCGVCLINQWLRCRMEVLNKRRRRFLPVECFSIYLLRTHQSKDI